MAHKALIPFRRALVLFARRDMGLGDSGGDFGDNDVIDLYARLIARGDSQSIILARGGDFARYRCIWLRYVKTLLPALEGMLIQTDWRLVLNYLESFPRPARGRKHAVPLSNPLYDAYLSLAGRNPLSLRGYASRMLYELKRGRGKRLYVPTCAGMLSPEECGFRP